MRKSLVLATSKKSLRSGIRKVRHLRNSSRLLAALNDEFTLAGQRAGGPLRLTTLVTSTFDRMTGEFNFAYAAHPRMLLWRNNESRRSPIGEGLTGLPIGFIAGKIYTEQSIKMDEGDVVLAFSDGVTEAFSPTHEQLGPEDILSLAEETIAEIPSPISLDLLSVTLIDKIERFHGMRDLDDDLTLLALRRLKNHL
jgi:phosphoserine phosphatase RsbU/P